jgi:hypothetical protein
VIVLASFIFSILFSGDVIHNGMDSDEDNYRLFFYCPTRDNQVSWSLKQAQMKKSMRSQILPPLRDYMVRAADFTTKHTKN